MYKLPSIFGFTLALSISACVLGCGRGPSEPQAMGAQATEASPGPGSVTGVNANDVRKLVADAKGKTVVINLWATWCPPCVAEMPALKAFYNKADADKLLFLSLSADDISTMGDVTAFAKEKRLPFPVYVLDDTVEQVNTALKTSISGALPTTVVLTPEGSVKQLIEGPVTAEQLRELTRD